MFGSLQTLVGIFILCILQKNTDTDFWYMCMESSFIAILLIYAIEWCRNAHMTGNSYNGDKHFAIYHFILPNTSGRFRLVCKRMAISIDMYCVKHTFELNFVKSASVCKGMAKTSADNLSGITYNVSKYLWMSRKSLQKKWLILKPLLLSPLRYYLSSLRWCLFSALSISSLTTLNFSFEYIYLIEIENYFWSYILTNIHSRYPLWWFLMGSMALLSLKLQSNILYSTIHPMPGTVQQIHKHTHFLITLLGLIAVILFYWIHIFAIHQKRKISKSYLIAA